MVSFSVALVACAPEMMITVPGRSRSVIIRDWNEVVKDREQSSVKAPFDSRASLGRTEGSLEKSSSGWEKARHDN